MTDVWSVEQGLLQGAQLQSDICRKDRVKYNINNIYMYQYYQLSASISQLTKGDSRLVGLLRIMTPQQLPDQLELAQYALVSILMPPRLDIQCCQCSLHRLQKGHNYERQARREYENRSTAVSNITLAAFKRGGIAESK